MLYRRKFWSNKHSVASGFIAKHPQKHTIIAETLQRIGLYSRWSFHLDKMCCHGSCASHNQKWRKYVLLNDLHSSSTLYNYLRYLNIIVNLKEKFSTKSFKSCTKDATWGLSPPVFLDIWILISIFAMAKCCFRDANSESPAWITCLWYYNGHRNHSEGKKIPSNHPTSPTQQKSQFLEEKKWGKNSQNCENS